MSELTKDADKLLAVLYKSYLDKLENGVSKSDAKMLGGTEEINKELLPTSDFDYIDETCRELGRAGMLKNTYADDTVYLSQLTDKAIVYLESKFERNVNKVFDFIGRIPFIGKLI